MSEQKVNLELVKELGLTEEEFELIKKYLGREPNFTELSIYSVMWSEHASYKNSIKWLKTLPRKGECLLAEAGEENAGLVDIGNNLACAFKIESHNHPSAVEPYQGAATGVGGINRDIFTMGARPIAQLNSLRFGNPNSNRTKYLLKGVVKGIGDYGNAFGVPVLGGELFFDESYDNNPLVNAMSVGIVEKGKTLSAKAEGAGNPVFIVGSSTGKDGIHGSTFASMDLSENSADDIPSIQVGDPFQEKLLLEATLELAETDAIVGMQDMGAAGIICSTSEMSARGNCGMRIDLSKVPLRQKNIDAWEILLSESQERMLVVIKKGKEDIVKKIFEKWDLNCAQIGEVIDEDKLYFYYKGELVAEVPAQSLVLGGGAPVYDREYKEPNYLSEIKKFDIDSIPEPTNLKEVADFLTSHPNIASKKWVYEQYDTMVRTVNLTTNRPADAGVINIKGTQKALAVTTDCNSRYVKSDPEKGAMIAVAEAARNIACTGAKPLAITNCLNFGSPLIPESYWEFVMAVKGMGKACSAFNTPVTGGNVSFYNQTTIGGVSKAVNPTPVIGMLGILEDKSYLTALAFKQKGDMIYLVGNLSNDICSSEYLYSYHKVKLSPAPEFDLDFEVKLNKILQELAKKSLVNSMHDVSDGGLYITLLESAMPNNLGFDITTASEVRTDSFLFGEAQGRVVVSVPIEKEMDFVDFMMKNKFPFYTLGHVTKGELRIDDISFGFISDAKEKYETALEKLLES
ncbi:MAG TPA: phosphoribosylformylglycinamidine synthase subunit PurL [Bacteroidales bacterium]|nr:phosphoribosylformylglycinamidine synthase subunit PurL [Bacteroidales bacterium]HOL98873.1 phosphoribosylformylglycinamidine synthase subunit PurL [Bacteroidales bacterium]HPD24714.1 phosphoribosylformylglycinamidine synthase subunit PurL [Bacteroidales bacterium]HRT00459.1 phosphoribosylformylglycinamidine synthase subunit PurL [Bacteroidales bacterium]HRT80933.1 phosphoribosylformylglycinamidine synthase subunit PurL [Bacteroidales bacterium]